MFEVRFFCKGAAMPRPEGSAEEVNEGAGSGILAQIASIITNSKFSAWK